MIKSFLSGLSYSVSQAVDSLSKNKLMAFASVVIVNACIFAFALSLCIIINISYSLDKLEKSVGIELYLGDTPTDEQVQSLKTQLEKIPHVSSVTYVSAEEALEKAESMWGAQSLEGLKEGNPFPRSFELKVDGIGSQKSVLAAVEALRKEFERVVANNIIITETTTQTTTLLTTTTRETTTQTTTSLTTTTRSLPYYYIKPRDRVASGRAARAVTTTQATTQATTVAPLGLPTPGIKSEAATESTTMYIPDVGADGYIYKGIEYISHAGLLTDTLIALDAAVKTIAVLVTLLLGAIAAGIIINTTRLTVMLRKNEISIMKYIGATDWFIREPFVIEGLLIGFVGALLPCALCALIYSRLYSYFNTSLDMLNTVVMLKPTGELFAVVTPVCLLLGMGLGAFAAYGATRKYLKV